MLRAQCSMSLYFRPDCRVNRSDSILINTNTHLRKFLFFNLSQSFLTPASIFFFLIQFFQIFLLILFWSLELKDYNQLINRKSSMEDYIYRKARKRVKQKKGFFIHFSVYIAVGVFFLTMNLVTDPWDLWFFYPLLPWGVALLIHYFSIFGLPGK